MKTLKKNNISKGSSINSPVPVNKDCELPPFLNEDYFGHVVVQTIAELNDIPCKLRQDGMVATVVQDSYAEWQLQSSRIGFSKCDNRSWVKMSDGDLDIKGKVSATNVPNSTGSIVTWNTTSKVFGLRTNAQIISDLNLSSSFVPYTGATANVDLGSRSITSTGGFIGNASTATTLATARTINGTSFNGSANITTDNWGTARNITIGNTTKSVNGSGNVAWSLSEIGASSVSHTHPISDIVGLQTELNKIGNLPSLTTTNKTSLVGAVNEVNNIQIGGRNLLIKSKLIPGYIHPDDGRLVQWSTFMYNPDYIPIGNNKNITFKHHKNNGVTNEKAGLCIVFYNENKSFLGGSYKWEVAEGQEIIRTIPLEAKFFRYTVTNINFDSKYEFGNKATDLTPAPEDQVETTKEFVDNKISNFSLPTNWSSSQQRFSGLVDKSADATYNRVLVTNNIGQINYTDLLTSEFIKFTENGKVGFALKYRKDNPTFYSAIGNNAVDLSIQTASSRGGASGNDSVAIGSMGKSTGVSSTSLGNSNTASGNNSLAAGTMNTANGSYSLALGYLNTASQGGDNAIGYKNIANGGYATAMGVMSEATGVQSVAMGTSSRAVGRYSTAIGYGVKSSTELSTAIGNVVESYSHNSIVMGSYNVVKTGQSQTGDPIVPTDDLFVIGNGFKNPTTGIATYSNALEIRNNGHTLLPSTTATMIEGNVKSVITKEYLDIRIPKPPTTGEYALKSINGVVSWVSI